MGKRTKKYSEPEDGSVRGHVPTKEHAIALCSDVFLPQDSVTMEQEKMLACIHSWVGLTHQELRALRRFVLTNYEMCDASVELLLALDDVPVLTEEQIQAHWDAIIARDMASAPTGDRARAIQNVGEMLR